jgi:hypothetical protein
VRIPGLALEFALETTQLNARERYTSSDLRRRLLSFSLAPLG